MKTIFRVIKKYWNGDFHLNAFEHEYEAKKAIEILKAKDTERNEIIKRNREKKPHENDEFVWDYTYERFTVITLDEFKKMN